MRKLNFMLPACLAVLMLQPLCSFAEEDTDALGTFNLLVNPGFEQLKYSRLVAWQFNNVSPGKWALAKLPGEMRSDRASLRIENIPDKPIMTVAENYYAVPSGRICRLSLWARGEGTLRLGFNTFTGDPDKPVYSKACYSDPFRLGSEWKQCSFTLGTEVIVAGGITSVTPAIALVADGTKPSVAYLDDADLRILKD